MSEMQSAKLQEGSPIGNEMPGLDRRAGQRQFRYAHNQQQEQPQPSAAAYAPMRSKCEDTCADKSREGIHIGRYNNVLSTPDRVNHADVTSNFPAASAIRRNFSIRLAGIPGSPIIRIEDKEIEVEIINTACITVDIAKAM